MANPQITVRHWQFLCSLARHGSIGSVARHEHHSETVVRRHLKDLSRACSVDIIDTSSGVARVTPAGKLLLDLFAPIGDDQATIEQQMQHLLTVREDELPARAIEPEMVGV